MTNKEAIHVLEIMAIDLTGAMAGLSKNNPMFDVLSQRIEAIDRAQEALSRWDDYLRNIFSEEKHG